MTYAILKSIAPPDLEEQVADYIKKLLRHRFTIDEPAPTAPGIVENCVLRVQYPAKERRPDDFIADYEIIDDTPPAPPPPTLNEKKDKLHFAVVEKEQQHCRCVLPPGKARLYSIRYQDLSSLKSQTILRGEEFVPSAEDKVFMEEYEQIVSRLDKTHRAVAHILAEIEDLTEDNIDSWVPPEITS